MSEIPEVDLAHAVASLMARLMEASDRPHGPTLDEAKAAVAHLTGTKQTMLGALAILGLQRETYRRQSPEDANLALHNIGTVIDDFRERTRK